MLINYHFLFKSDNGIQLHYNPQNVWCDWPQNVDCGNRPICDILDQNCEENEKPTKKPAETCESLGSCSTNENGNLEPLGTCKSCFCQCANHVYSQLCCPSGLVFNPDLNICDWPNHTPGC